MCARVDERVAFGKPLSAQGVVRESIAESLVGPLYPVEADHVGADAEDHRSRASVIRRFISMTAVDSPSKMARATMAWPMLSSMTSGRRAIGCTL